MTGMIGVERVGPSYSLARLLEVRQRTREAVGIISQRLDSGMTERDAKVLAQDTLSELGLRRGWHRTYVRCGTNTAKPPDEASDDAVLLGTNDIYFIDIGPVYDGIEGDAGDTFVLGDNPDHRRIQRDVHAIWWHVRQQWLDHGMTGQALYDLAAEASRHLGWVLDLTLSGHRLSEFPHKAHYAGSLSEVDLVPAPGLWVLEIAIVHPDRRFGAFYEDVLVDDESMELE
jgi:Xaa-Pro aminopeptidase